MYQVIQMTSTDEPWWFFEHWKQKITQVTTFSTLEEAKYEYAAICHKFSTLYRHSKIKKGMIAFWNEEETEYCIPCDEDLQIYHGILVMDDSDSVIEMGEEGKRG